MELWSWLLTGIGLVGFWLVGRHRWAWLVLCGWEVLWAVYAVATRQYGFLVSAIVFTGVFGRNYLLPGPDAHNGNYVLLGKGFQDGHGYGHNSSIRVMIQA